MIPSSTGDSKGVDAYPMARHLHAMGAHIGIFTETRLHGNDKHTIVVSMFLEHGILALSHNIKQLRKT